MRGEELTVRKPERRSLGGFERRTGEKRGREEDYDCGKLRRRKPSVGLRGEERRERRPEQRVCWREEDDGPGIFSPTLWNLLHGLVHASPEKPHHLNLGEGRSGVTAGQLPDLFAHGSGTLRHPHAHPISQLETQAVTACTIRNCDEAL